MTTRPATPLTRLFTRASFLAVPVVAIILISVTRPDPTIVKGLADLAAAYLVWRAAAARQAPRDNTGPQAT